MKKKKPKQGENKHLHKKNQYNPASSFLGKWLTSVWRPTPFISEVWEENATAQRPINALCLHISQQRQQLRSANWSPPSFKLIPGSMSSAA